VTSGSRYEFTYDNRPSPSPSLIGGTGWPIRAANLLLPPSYGASWDV